MVLPRCPLCMVDKLELKIEVIESGEVFLVCLGCLKLTFNSLQNIKDINDIFNNAIGN